MWSLSGLLLFLLHLLSSSSSSSSSLLTVVLLISSQKILSSLDFRTSGTLPSCLQFITEPLTAGGGRSFGGSFSLPTRSGASLWGRTQVRVRPQDEQLIREKSRNSHR
ncbi:uncharacterized protein V6R79_020577 [Siganus canaliculatus]